MARIKGQLLQGAGTIDATNPALNDENMTGKQVIDNIHPDANRVEQLNPNVTTAAASVVGQAATGMANIAEQQNKINVDLQTLPTPTEQTKVVQPTTQVTSLAQPTAPTEQPKPSKEATTTTTLTPPEEGAGEVEKAEHDIELLSTFARDALTSTDDPTSKMKFNQALSNIGLFNQAQRELLQQQINSDPSFAGQPTGTALLSMLARQQGFDVSNLITDLSVESANRIRDLNRWGFERMTSINKVKEQDKFNIRNEMLLAGDFTGYAARFKEDTGVDIDVSSLKELSPATRQAVAEQQNMLTEALRSGDMVKAKEIFDVITALAPNTFQGADFDSMNFEEKSFLLSSEQTEIIDAQIRLDIAQGDTDAAVNGIETKFTLEERIAGGVELFNTKSLEEVNAALATMGQAPIEDITELIGREDELFTAFKINEIANESSKTVVDDISDFLTRELQQQFKGVMLDDTDMQLIRSMAMDLSTGGFFHTDSNGDLVVDPSELISPWESGSISENQFKHWPTMDADGTVSGSDEFYTTSNPQAAPDTAIGKYEADLDRKWDEYISNTTRGETVSMLAWFRATQAGTVPFDENNLREGDKKPVSPVDEVEIEALKANIAAMSITDFNNKMDNDPSFFTNVTNIATNFATASSLENLSMGKLSSDIINGPTNGIVKIDGNVVKFGKITSIDGGGPIRHMAIDVIRLDDSGNEIGTAQLIMSGPDKGKFILTSESNVVDVGVGGAGFDAGSIASIVSYDEYINSLQESE